jgi:hypothetical protein
MHHPCCNTISTSFGRWAVRPGPLEAVAVPMSAGAAELDIDARLQTAREQFQQRLQLIKRDLLLGQAELSQRDTAPGADAWLGAELPARPGGGSFHGGGGSQSDDELTAQVIRVTYCRACLLCQCSRLWKLEARLPAHRIRLVRLIDRRRLNCARRWRGSSTNCIPKGRAAAARMTPGAQRWSSPDWLVRERWLTCRR